MMDAKESPAAEEEEERTRSGYPSDRRGKTVRVPADDIFVREKIAEKTNIMLPNVKELTKKFAKGIEEFLLKTSPTPSSFSNITTNGGYIKNESLAEQSEKSLVDQDGLELENLSSNIAVNKAKLSRTSSATSPNSEDSLKEEIVKNGKDILLSPETSNGENGEKIVQEKSMEGRVMKTSCSTTSSKFAGKEVHSLTARSISKEFREELKNNSSRRNMPKVDKGSSGESDQVEIVSESIRNRSPTPPIDLQSKRKFWEDIISNAQK